MSASTVWTVQQSYDDGADSREGYGNGDGANDSHGHDTSQRGRFPPKPRCHCCCGSASLTEAALFGQRRLAEMQAPRPCDRVQFLLDGLFQALIINH